MSESSGGSENSFEDQAAESLDRADTIEHLESPDREQAIDLEAATTESESAVELSRDFAEAEAIEGAVVEALESQQAFEGSIPAEVLGQPEQSDTPARDERSSSGYAGGSSREGNVHVGDGEMLGFVKSIEGGMTKAEISSHELGDENIQKKNIAELDLEGELAEFQEGVFDRIRPGNPDAPQMEQVEIEQSIEAAVDEFPDFLRFDQDQPTFDFDLKPIPAAEAGEVALDGKGDDVVALDGKGGDFQPDMKFIPPDPAAEPGKVEGPSPKMEIHPKIDSVDPELKVELGHEVIPKLEMEQGSVDFKIFQSRDPDLNIEVGGVIPKLETDDMVMVEGVESYSGYENLLPVLGRAVSDPAFRERLAVDPVASTREYDLDEDAVVLLSQIDPERLEEMATEVRASFADTDDPELQAAQGNLLAELIWGSSGEHKLDADFEGGVEHHDSWKGE